MTVGRETPTAQDYQLSLEESPDNHTGHTGSDGREEGGDGMGWEGEGQ